MGSAKLLVGIVTALAVGGGVLWVSPAARTALDTAIKTAQGIPAKKSDKGDPAHAHGQGDNHAGEGAVRLTPEQIAKAKVELAAVAKGSLARRLSVPGAVIPDSDRIGRVAAKVIGTVAELRKRLGDAVTKGEVIAVLESREVADAKSDYLAAVVNFDLQKTLFDREKTLWEKKITAEQQFLRARSVFTEAQLRMNVARQKLSALDLSEAEVESLPSQPITSLRHKEIRAPLSGQVVERRVDMGAPVGGEGQEKELYVIADLSSVWVEMSVPVRDLPAVKVGQTVSVVSAGDTRGQGTVEFISPLLSAETRNARVIATIENPAMTWRPGAFVTAHIVVEEHEADLVIARSALQTIGGEQVVFVRTADGFEKREVVVGRLGESHAEVLFGLDAGEMVAVTNSFVLKAELGKAEADHGHAH